MHKLMISPDIGFFFFSLQTLHNALLFPCLLISFYKRVIFIFSNPRKAKGFLGNKKDFTPTNANQ